MRAPAEGVAGRPRREGEGEQVAPGDPPPRSAGLRTAALLIVLALALGLRLEGLERRVFSHPENFVPGIDVPDWTSFPPERDDVPSILRGTLLDGHPPTYFVALLPWVRAFGTELASLRLPSALAGFGAVLLLYALGRREADRRTALLAALLLALHGHHVYWSQLARMYTLTACLGVLSTLLLWRARELGRRRDLWAYVAATVAALWTQLYAWPLVLGQMLWVAYDALRRGRAAPLFAAQQLALIVSLPVVQLSLYQNPPTRWAEPDTEWWQLGYAFFSQAPFWEGAPALPVPRGVLLLATFGLLVLALGRRVPDPAAADAGDGRPWPAAGLRWGVALGVALPMAAFPWAVTWGSAAAGPLLHACALLPLFGAWALPRLQEELDRLAARWPRPDWPSVPLSLALAVVPFAAMVVLGIVRPSLVARGTIVFVPYLALALAHGARRCMKWPWLGLPLVAVLVLAHAGSWWWWRGAESCPKDYEGLARELERQVAPGDVLLVQDSYVLPPLFYYLDDELERRLVHGDWRHAARVADRVWTIRFQPEDAPELGAAVAHLVPARTIELPGAWATLHEAR